jgi:UDP-glucose 4-epimerase
MRVLVTGGAGFIGSWICDALIDAGHEVLAYDDLSSGTRGNLASGIGLEVGDIRDADRLQSVFRSYRPEAVFHQAAQVSVSRSMEDPVQDADVNITGSLRVLEASLGAGVRRFVFASTAAVYGAPQQCPTIEDEPTVPESPYGLAKRTVEGYLAMLTRGTTLTPSILRYANVYGPRQNVHGEAGVVAIFCERLSGRQDVTIYGDGEQTRDFVFVGDVARANVAALHGPGGVYNVSTADEHTVNQLAAMLESVSARTLPRSYQDSPKVGLVRSCLSNDRIHQQLQWRPRVGLREGLQRTWQWFDASAK